MKVYDMLIELIEAVADGDVYNDNCEHVNPSDPYEYCDVCFLINVAKNASAIDFLEETTPRQRERIEELWEKL